MFGKHVSKLDQQMTLKKKKMEQHGERDGNESEMVEVAKTM